MLRITEMDVRNHADDLLISNLALAEQDLRLTSILAKIYLDEFLSERLLLKGGTAINKLYLKTTPRLSIDLDFNHIGPKDKVLSEREELREKIHHILSREDSSYHITSSRRYEQTTITVRYTPLFGVAQHIKVEISHIERFPILPPEQLEMHISVSGGVLKVSTYNLNELASTKLRAFYERLSGRDIYDLFFVSQLGLLNPAHVRKMLIYYFYRSRKVFNPKLFFKKIEDASSKSRGFEDDVSGFVRSDIEFSLSKAVFQILTYYSFLKEADPQDTMFISLTRHLLNRPVTRNDLKLIRRIKYPLRFLFGESEENKLSEEARNIRTEDIRLFLKPKRRQR